MSKGENLAMSTQKSTNILPIVHRVITSNLGENYWFNGCAHYVMECLGEKDYTYLFFSGLTGDVFTQPYYPNDFVGDGATECYITSEGGSYIEKILHKVGYACTFVPAKQILNNLDMYRQAVVDSIDKGVPVISYPWTWSVIIGYEDAGQTLLVMNGDSEEPKRVDFNTMFTTNVNGLPEFDRNPEAFMEKFGFGMYFVGDKQQCVDLAALYRDMMLEIPARLAYKTDNYIFGADAFKRWADDINSGRFDDMKPDAFDQWTMYTCYVCCLATNSCGSAALFDKALELNPELTFLAETKKLYAKTGEMWNNENGKDLEAIGGGFNITLDTLQNKEKRAIITAKLREFAEIYTQISNSIPKNLQ